MLFDSHIELLLEAAVSLVNDLTDGEWHGKRYAAPTGAELPAAAAAALPGRGQGRVPEQVPGESAAYLSRAARVMRGVFEAMQEGRVDDAAGAINRLLRETGARPQLDRVAGEPWQVHFHGSSDTFGVGWSAGCATALALAVGSELAGRLGVCGAPHCDRVFVDASRNSVRRFCSAACQSRVKAAAFRARRDSGDSERRTTPRSQDQSLSSRLSGRRGWRGWRGWRAGKASAGDWGRGRSSKAVGDVRGGREICAA